MPPKEEAKPKKGGKEAKEKKRLAKLHEQQLKESKQHVDTGLGFMEKSQFSKAIPCFNQAIEVNPENMEAFLNRGKAYKEQKEYDKAIADFTRAIELAPDTADAYANRGNCYDNVESYDRAIADYSKVIDLCPDDDHAYNMRGNARQSKRIPGLKLKNVEFAAVVNDFTRALELNPYNYFAYCNRANAYFDRKDFRSAIEDFTSAIQIKVDYVYAYLRRGIACYESVLYDEKMAKMKDEEDKIFKELSNQKGTKVVTDNVQQVWEEQFKAVCAKERKEKDRLQLLQNAITDFTTVLTFDEQDSQALGHRAKVYDMLGMKDKANEDRIKAGEIEARAALKSR